MAVNSKSDVGSEPVFARILLRFALARENAADSAYSIEMAQSAAMSRLGAKLSYQRSLRMLRSYGCEECASVVVSPGEQLAYDLGTCPEIACGLKQDSIGEPAFAKACLSHPAGKPCSFRGDKFARRIQAHYSSITDVISNPIAS